MRFTSTYGGRSKLTTASTMYGQRINRQHCERHSGWLWDRLRTVGAVAGRKTLPCPANVRAPHDVVACVDGSIAVCAGDKRCRIAKVFAPNDVVRRVNNSVAVVITRQGDERVGKNRVRQKRIVGECVQERDDVAGLFLGEVQLRRVLEARIKKLAVLHSGTIELYDVFKRGEPTVVHESPTHADVSQRRCFEAAVAGPGVRRDDIEADVVRKVTDLSGCRVAGGTSRGVVEERSAGLLGRRPRRLAIQVGVVFRIVRNHRSLELRNRLGDEIRRNFRGAESGREQRWVESGLAEFGDDLGKRRAHFRGTLDRLQGLVFDRGGALVPKHSAAFVEGDIRKSYRVPARELAIDSGAELVLVREAFRLLVARGAGGRVVVRETLIVKKGPAECSAGIRGYIVGRPVVERRGYIEVLRRTIRPRILHVAGGLCRQTWNLRRRSQTSACTEKHCSSERRNQSGQSTNLHHDFDLTETTGNTHRHASQTNQYDCRRFGNVGASDRPSPRRKARAVAAPPSSVVVHGKDGAETLSPDDVIGRIHDVISIV